MVASKPGRPSSATVGNSGISEKRLSVVTASGRSVPDLMNPITEAEVANISWRVSGDEILQRRRGALVGHRHDVDLGLAT